MISVQRILIVCSGLVTEIAAKFEFFDPFNLPQYIPGSDFNLLDALFLDILSRQKELDAEVCEDVCWRMQNENLSSCAAKSQSTNKNTNATDGVPLVCVLSRTTIARNATVTSSSIYGRTERLWSPTYINDGFLWSDSINFFHSEEEPSPWVQLSWGSRDDRTTHHSPRLHKFTDVIVFLRLNFGNETFDNVEVMIGTWSSVGQDGARADQEGAHEKRCGDVYRHKGDDAGAGGVPRTHVRFSCQADGIEDGIEGNYVLIQMHAPKGVEGTRLYINEVEVYTTNDNVPP